MKKRATRMKETMGTDFMTRIKGESRRRSGRCLEANQAARMARAVATNTLRRIRPAERRTDNQPSAFENRLTKVRTTLPGDGKRKPVPAKEARICQRIRSRSAPAAIKNVSFPLLGTVIEIFSRQLAAYRLWIDGK